MKPSIAFLKRHSLSMGLLLMFLLTWPIDLGHAAETRGLLPFQIPFTIYITLGYGFIWAALIMTGLTLGKEGVIALLKRYLQWRVGWQWYLVAFLLMPAIMAAAVWLNSILSQTPIDFSTAFVYQIFGRSANPVVLFLPYLVFDALTNGEEIGWRGYVLPRLQVKYSALASTLIVGAIWGLWHLPKFVAAGDHGSFGWFTAEIMARAFLYTWLFNNTRGSLLLVTLFHAAGNAAGLMLPLTNTATGENQSTLVIMFVLEVIIVGAIAVREGAARLSRTEPMQVQA